MLIKKSRFFLCVPLLVILAGLAFLSQLFPLSLNSGGYYGQDPAYQYLFTGVDILQGHAADHTNHPGTRTFAILVDFLGFNQNGKS